MCTFEINQHIFPIPSFFFSSKSLLKAFEQVQDTTIWCIIRCESWLRGHPLRVSSLFQAVRQQDPPSFISNTEDTSRTSWLEGAGEGIGMLKAFGAESTVSLG